MFSGLQWGIFMLYCKRNLCRESEFLLTAYEQMMKYEIGLEIGLLSMEELRAFLSQRLRDSDVPYIYTAVFLTLDKGTEDVTETIFYNMQGKYIMDRAAGNTVQRLLIGVIGDKWRSGAIDREQCVRFLHRLTDYSECGWELLAIEEYYRLNQSGYSSDEEFGQMLDNILSQGLS